MGEEKNKAGQDVVTYGDIKDLTEKHSDPDYKVETIVDVPPGQKKEEDGQAFPMQAIIDDLNRREEKAKAKVDAERKADEKKQKRMRLINAIGDGISSLANIYFTNQGAPDMLKGSTSLSAKNQERWDKLRTEREARRDAYLKVVRDGNKERLKNAYTQWKDNRDYEMEKEALELKRRDDDRKERRAALDARRADLDYQLKLGKITEQEYQNAIAKAEADAAEDYYSNRAKKAGIVSRGGGSKNGSSAGKNYITVFEYEYLTDENGELVIKRGKPVIKDRKTRRLFVGTPEYDEYMKEQGGNGSGKSNSKKGWSAKNRK